MKIPEPSKTKCSAALIIKGEFFPCDNQAPHDGWAHGNRDAEAIWDGPTEVDEP